MPHTGTTIRCFQRCSLLLFALGMLLSTTAYSEPLRFQSGKTAFDQGDFATSFKIFHTLTKQQPGDPEADFLLGRSAFEIGDFETAIFAFERILISQPDADRVRLELARSYFEIGALESARSNFNRVLVKQPPSNVRQNIEHYLKLISKAGQQHNFSGYLTLGISYDDNVYASPVDEQVETLLGKVTLYGTSATPQEDLINQNSLQLNHLYRSHPKKVGWLSSLQLYNSRFASESDLNLILVGLNSGPLWLRGQQKTKLQLNVNYLTLADDRYLSIYGLTAEHSWKLSRNLAATISGQVSRQDYADDARVADQLRLEYKQRWQRPTSSLDAGIALESNWADADEYSYLRGVFSALYQRPLTWKLTGMLGVQLQQTDYDGKIEIFGKARRDQQGKLSFGLNRSVWEATDGNGRIEAQFSGTLSKIKSNIDLYEYDKQVFTLSLSYLF